MNECTLLVNIFGDWWWNILNIILSRIVRSGSSMKQLCTSFSWWQNRIHVLLIRLVNQITEQLHSTFDLLLLLHSVQYFFRRIIVYIMQLLYQRMVLILNFCLIGFEESNFYLSFCCWSWRFLGFHLTCSVVQVLTFVLSDCWDGLTECTDAVVVILFLFLYFVYVEGFKLSFWEWCYLLNSITSYWCLNWSSSRLISDSTSLAFFTHWRPPHMWNRSLSHL